MSTSKTTYDGRSALRNPCLTKAVMKQLGGGEEARQTTIDVAQHGADGGYLGFTYTRETVAFYKANKGLIINFVDAQANDLGVDMLEMIRDFACLKDLNLKPYDVCKGLYGVGEHADAIQNAMAWFALEEVSRELNPDV